MGYKGLNPMEVILQNLPAVILYFKLSITCFTLSSLESTNSKRTHYLIPLIHLTKLHSKSLTSAYKRVTIR
jgi:hypothetical protein